VSESKREQWVEAERWPWPGKWQPPGTFCSPPRSNPHVLSCWLRPVVVASLPWGRAAGPLPQGRRVEAGFVQCEVAVLRQKLQSAWEQLCFLHGPAQRSALPAPCLVHC